MSRDPLLSSYERTDTTQRRAAALLPKVFNDIFHDEPSRYLLACLDPVSAVRFQRVNKATRATTSDLWSPRTNRNPRTEKNPYLTQTIQTQKLAISVLRSKPGNLRRIPLSIDGQLASIGNTSGVLKCLGLPEFMRRPESELQTYAQRAFLQSEIRRVIKANNNLFRDYQCYTSISSCCWGIGMLALYGLLFGVGITAIVNANEHYGYDEGINIAASVFFALLIVGCVFNSCASRRAKFFRKELSANRSQYATVIETEEARRIEESRARTRAYEEEERRNPFYMTV